MTPFWKLERQIYKMSKLEEKLFFQPWISPSRLNIQTQIIVLIKLDYGFVMDNLEREEEKAVGRVIHGWQVELTLGAAPDYFTSQLVHLSCSAHREDGPGSLSLRGPDTIQGPCPIRRTQCVYFPDGDSWESVSSITVCHVSQPLLKSY